MITKGKFLSVLHKNIYCGHSLESSRQGVSNTVISSLVRTVKK